MFFLYNLELFAALILGIVGYRIAPSIFGLKISSVVFFVKFMVSLAIVRTALGYYLSPDNFGSVPNYWGSDHINVMFGVWWEDLFFVLPALLVYHFFGKKGIIWLSPLFVFTTFLFAQGHLYQGNIGWILGIYPILAFFMARKYGLTTVMVCHVLYDVIVFTELFGLREIAVLVFG